jgi:hypothetical protein
LGPLMTFTVVVIGAASPHRFALHRRRRAS